MDQKDRNILRILQTDARTPQAEIGRQIGLSAAAVNERIRKLERDGTIRRYAALLDDRKVGVDIIAFIDVFIESPAHEEKFTALMNELPEVQECHFVTGDFSCIVKARVPDRRSLRELVLDRINALAGVRQTRTWIVLATTKETPDLPRPDDTAEGEAGAGSRS